MSQFYTISLPSNSSPGPYNIYYNFLNSGFLAPIYNSISLAENLSLSQLISGVTVIVPDNTTVIYLYNNSECDSAQSFPIQTPLPVYDDLCVTYTCADSIQQFEFSWNGSVSNGKPVFSATGGYELTWITANTPNYWEITGLSPVIRSNDPNIPPISDWYVVGIPPCGRDNTFVEGTRGKCSAAKSLPVIQVNKSNPTCFNLSDGGISVNVLGGNPPYTYSIDGINYFPSPVFPNLNSSPYNIFIKDASGNTTSQLVTLIGPPQTNHQFNVNQLSFSQISQVGNTKYYQLNYSISPNLSLPLGTTANIGLSLEYNLSYVGPGTPVFYTTGNTIIKNGFTQIPTQTVSTPPFINGFSPCNPLYNTFAGQDVYFRNFTYQNGDSVSGTCIFGIDSFTSGTTVGPCFTSASIGLNVKTEIISVNCDCCNCSGNVLNKNINVTYFSYP